MRRMLIAVPLALVLGFLPSQAATTTSARVYQGYTLNAMDMLSGQNISLSIYRDRDSSSTSTNLDWRVWASSRTCVMMTCTYKNFPEQSVPGTALVFDPLGNSGSFTGLMLADQPANQAFQFDLTFTRPSTLGACATCVIPTAWVDPETSTVGGSASGSPGLFRTGYTVAGIFAGSPYVPFGPPYGWVNDMYQTTLMANATAIAP